MAGPDDEYVALTLPIAEVNELLAGLQRSIAWQQQIVSKVILQAKAQGKVRAEPALPPAQMDDNEPPPPPPDRPPAAAARSSRGRFAGRPDGPAN